MRALACNLDFVSLADFFANLANEIDTESQKFLIRQQNNHSINTSEILKEASTVATDQQQTVCSWGDIVVSALAVRNAQKIW